MLISKVPATVSQHCTLHEPAIAKNHLAKNSTSEESQVKNEHLYLQTDKELVPPPSCLLEKGHHGVDKLILSTKHQVTDPKGEGTNIKAK